MKRSERKAQHTAILAAQIRCSVRSVAYVRSANPNEEEMARRMQAMDGIFPGIYQWHLDTQERKRK